MMFFCIDVVRRYSYLCKFIKNRLQHRCFPVKFAKFFTTLFFKRNSLVATSEQTNYLLNKTLKIAEKNIQLAASEVKDNLSTSEPHISSFVPKCGCKLGLLLEKLRVEDVATIAEISN